MVPRSIHVNKVIGLVLVLTTLVGCGSSRNLVYRQNTVIGLEVSANPEGTSGKAVFGYDRESNAVVPKKLKGDGTTAGQDAMSAISVSHISIGFLEANCIFEAFATGDAATSLAKNHKAGKNVNGNGDGTLDAFLSGTQARSKEGQPAAGENNVSRCSKKNSLGN